MGHGNHETFNVLIIQMTLVQINCTGNLVNLMCGGSSDVILQTKVKEKRNDYRKKTNDFNSPSLIDTSDVNALKAVKLGINLTC